MIKLRDLLFEAIVLTEAEDRAAMLAQTVKNPDTNNDVTVKTALGYDKDHPARKAANRIYAAFMNKNKPATAKRPAPKRSTKPKSDGDYDDVRGGEAYKMRKAGRRDNLYDY
jgi:hypothetical protein